MTKTLTIVILAFAIANTIRYYVLLARGEFHSQFPVPMSLLIAITLTVILSRADGEGPVASFAIATLLFPLLQITLFGFTDYRRPADLIVVFGAGGTPLYERVLRFRGLHRAE